jgi:hypothetical protein
MRDLVVLFLHLISTIVRLAGSGGARSVIAESVLFKQQLLIVNRSRQRSPNLRVSDRIVAGLCVLLIRPSRLILYGYELAFATIHGQQIRRASSGVNRRHRENDDRILQRAACQVSPVSDWATEQNASKAPSSCFETGREHKLNLL